ncbi:MAG: diguanylate cyclase [Burkholderiales bacterium]
MNSSIRRKLIAGVGSLAGMLVFVAAIFALQSYLTRSEFTRITLVETPLFRATIAMGDASSRISDAVLSFLNDRDPAHLARIAPEEENFARHLKQFESLAAQPELLQLGHRSDVAFRRFGELAKQIVAKNGELTENMQGALAAFDGLNQLFESNTISVGRVDATEIGEKRDAALMMKLAIKEMERALLGFLTILDPEWEESGKRALTRYGKQRDRYLRTKLALPDLDWLKRVDRVFAGGERNVSEVFNAFKSKQSMIDEFARHHRELNQLIATDMRLAVEAQVRAADGRMSTILDWGGLITLAMLIAGGAIGTIVGKKFYRGITATITRLQASTESLARGELSGSTAALDQSDVEFRPLLRSFEEMAIARVKAEEHIAARSREIEQTNQTLEDRNLESTQVTEMSNLMQTAVDLFEAGEILSRMLPRLLSPHAGAIYLTASSLNRLDCLTKWGAAEAVDNMSLEDCWAMRRGRSYRVNSPQHDIYCKHVHPVGEKYRTLCVPMMSHGTSLGLFFVELAGRGEDAELIRSERLRVQRLADQLSMALANLKLRQTLRELSIRDPLSGLFNRRYLEESMARDLSRAARESKPLAIFMIDVDHFKRFNDQFGHEAGDAVIRLLGRTLKESVRASDVAARYGGEEFTVVLYNAPIEGARIWAGRFMQSVHNLELKSRGNILPGITVSMGLAMFPDFGANADEVIQAADAALYESKRAGRDRLTVASTVSNKAETLEEPAVENIASDLPAREIPELESTV